MGQSPFRKLAFSTDSSSVSRRRSTRIDYTCPIVVSGRDVAGEFFCEMTQTSIVNLHGCKLRLQHRVLVGMIVSIESKATRISAKAVCVRVLDSEPGIAGCEIAVQLVKPQNLWGVENPPADWETVSLELVKGKSAPTPAKAEGVIEFPLPKDQRFTAAVEEAPPLSRPVLVEPEPQAAVSKAEVSLADLEQRAAQVMESVLQNFRTQADEIVRDTVDTLRQQIAALTKEADEQIKLRAEHTYEDVEGSLFELRVDLAEQLSQRTDQIVANVEETLHAKVGEMLATMLKPAARKESP